MVFGDLPNLMAIFVCRMILVRTILKFVFTAVECPPGMVYKQCASLCVQTCDNINENVICEGGCAEGCFCPDEQVLFEGQCVNPSRCTG